MLQVACAVPQSAEQSTAVSDLELRDSTRSTAPSDAANLLFSDLPTKDVATDSIVRRTLLSCSRLCSRQSQEAFFPVDCFNVRLKSRLMTTPTRLYMSATALMEQAGKSP